MLPIRAKIGNMSTVAIDKFGRVLIPKAVRDTLSVTSGQELKLTIEQGTLVLTPLNATELQVVDGLPLFDVPHMPEALETARQARHEELSGE